MPITGGVAGKVESVPGTTELLGISCPAGGGCVVVGGNGSMSGTGGVVLTVNHGALGTPVNAGGVSTLRAVACSGLATA